MVPKGEFGPGTRRGLKPPTDCDGIHDSVDAAPLDPTVQWLLTEGRMEIRLDFR